MSSATIYPAFRFDMGEHEPGEPVDGGA